LDELFLVGNRLGVITRMDTRKRASGEHQQRRGVRPVEVGVDLEAVLGGALRVDPKGMPRSKKAKP